MKNGRPPIYTPELALKVTLRLAEGESLRSVCRDNDMPARATVDDWIINDVNGFADQYARARNRGLDVMADQALEVSATSVEGKQTKRSLLTGTEVTTRDAVDRSRLHVDTLKWYLSKLAPKRYGDRLALEHVTDASLAERLIAARKRTGNAQ